MNNGFTLIESLVAISVLLLAVTGPLTLITKVISDSSVSQNQITAFYLGQEGLEYIKNKRENNFLEEKDWLNGLNQCFDECVVDVPNDDIQTAASYNDCPPDNTMKFDATGDYYNHQDGDKCTLFKRVVKITKINLGGANDEAKIECIVEWKEKSGTKSIVLEEHIFNWK